jgi:hypothetical protein
VARFQQSPFAQCLILFVLSFCARGFFVRFSPGLQLSGSGRTLPVQTTPTFTGLNGSSGLTQQLSFARSAGPRGEMEVARGARSMEFLFTLFVIDLARDANRGCGTGAFSPAFRSLRQCGKLRRDVRARRKWKPIEFHNTIFVTSSYYFHTSSSFELLIRIIRFACQKDVTLVKGCFSMGFLDF